MEADVAALRNLATVLLWSGAFILASLVYYVTEGIANAVTSLFLVGGALSDAVRSAEHFIVKPLDDLRQRSEREITRGLSGLVDNLAVWLGLAVLLGEGVKAALTYLWKHALSPFVHSIVDTIREMAHEALALAQSALKHAETVYDHAVHYADGVAARTLSEAHTYASAAALPAGHAAERYADTAVSTLRSAEAEAIKSAVGIAEAAATTADDAIKTALGDVRGIARTADEELDALVGKLGIAGTAGLIASIPALATLVHTIATETGLDRAECRGKVKQVCATNPREWEHLLAGLAATGLLLNLPAVVHAAALLARPVVALVKQAE